MANTRKPRQKKSKRIKTRKYNTTKGQIGSITLSILSFSEYDERSTILVELLEEVYYNARETLQKFESEEATDIDKTRPSEITKLTASVGKTTAEKFIDEFCYLWHSWDWEDDDGEPLPNPNDIDLFSFCTTDEIEELISIVNSYYNIGTKEREQGDNPNS